MPSKEPEEMKSYRVSDDLYLVKKPVRSSKLPKKAEPPPTHHILVFDCSGSMYYDLPKIRAQMKKRLPALLGEKDILSAIWFSGRDEFGVLLDAEPVPTLKDLAQVNAVIDRWLRPICLTGFLQPLKEVTSLVARTSKKHPNHAHALLFLSDGYDNQWNRNDILQAVEKVGAAVSAATFVEYGYYADRPLLTRMAEKAGGSLIFSEDFDRYAPAFEAHLKRQLSGAPRIEVELDGDIIGGFAFAMSDDDLVSYDASDGTAAVPEDLAELWYLSPTVVGLDEADVGKLAKELAQKPRASGVISAAYAAVSLFSLRAQPKVLLPLLKALGDVRFIEQFGGLFGKQAYSEYMELAKDAAFGKDRWVDGWDPTKVPRDDAFTVLDLLRILSDDEDNHVLLDSDDFKYKRIGRPAEPVEVEGQDPLEFKADPAPDGYSVRSLTFNETRPNVSILVKKAGTVDLKKRLKGTGHKLPANFPTFVYRNYTIIRDGIVNVDQLPVRMTKGTIQALVKAGMPESAIVKGLPQFKKAAKGRPVNVVIDLRAIPVINRNMVKDVSAEAMFRKQLELMRARGAQKVFNSVMKDKFPRESEGFKVLYGEDAAAWLKEQGITDYSGFGPKTKQADAKDYYMGKELKIALKGISSLPSLKDVQKKMAAGKLTARFELMSPAVGEVDDFLDSATYTKAANQDGLFKQWLTDKLAESKTAVRRLLFDMAQIRFSIIVGQTWFSEFSTIEENSLDIDGVAASVNMNEIQVEI